MYFWCLLTLGSIDNTPDQLWLTGMTLCLVPLLHVYKESAMSTSYCKAHTLPLRHNTSTNRTLNDNPITFPLNESLYVDATHEVVVVNIITALNLSNFAASGPLPADHIPANRTFVSSQLASFATNIQFQRKITYSSLCS